MVDIASSDMYLLFQSPRTVFDGTKMTKEFESNSAPSLQSEDTVAGTTEVGVGRSVSGVEADGPSVQVLLKAKVVLENDLTDS